MKLLLDMNLPPKLIDMLISKGLEAKHWYEIGASDAPDTEIMSYALKNNYVVLTCDLDFGAILSVTHGQKPSVMMKGATVNYMNPSVIKQEGIKALSAALTPVGMAYFFRLLESGEGNYTEEKDELTKDFTTSSIMSALGAMQKERE